MRTIINRTLLVALLTSTSLLATGCRSSGGSSWSNMWAGRSASGSAGLAASKPNPQLPPSPASSFASSASGGAGAAANKGYPSTGLSGPNLGAPSGSGNSSGYYTGPYATGGSGSAGAATAGTVAGASGNRAATASAAGAAAGADMTVPKVGYGSYPAAPASNTTSNPATAGDQGHDHAHDHGHDHGDHSHGAPQPPNPNAWNGTMASGMDGGFRPGTTARGRIPDANQGGAGSASSGNANPNDGGGAGEYESVAPPPTGSVEPSGGRFVPPQQ